MKENITEIKSNDFLNSVHNQVRDQPRGSDQHNGSGVINEQPGII